jgi:hypothetical protein
MNILVPVGPTMSVAKAIRHERSSQGGVFSLGLSIWYRGQKTAVNLDKPEVSR